MKYKFHFGYGAFAPMVSSAVSGTISYRPEVFLPSSWASNAQLALAQPDDRRSLTTYVRYIENNRLVQSARLGGVPIRCPKVAVPRTDGVRGSIKS